MATKRRKSYTWIILLFLALLSVSAFIAYNYYQKIFKAVVDIVNEEKEFFVYSDWDRENLIHALLKEGIIQDRENFIWVSDQKKFNVPKGGKYLIKRGMSNNDLVNMFRSGMQSPISLTFNSIRTDKDLASRIGAQLECDSLSLIQLIQSNEIASKYGFNTHTFLSMFIPNTYEFYWNTSAEEFLKRMATEYKRYWNEERKQKARNIGLSQSEVAILASIVQAEQMMHPDERPRVAGLYINRLKKGMRLQSDPTLVYALGDFTINRVLNKHKAIDSPFNTYIYTGLPPAPINLPELSSLEAVLDFEKHDYLYMCAKADFSSYHNFSKSLSQHNVYANAYRRELNRRKIMR